MERLCLNCMKIYIIKPEYEKMNCQCPYCGFVDNTPPKDGMHLPPGTILNNKYIVGTVIGAGGFGATYRGWDNTLARVVAIKEYLPKGLVVRQRKELVVKSESDYEFLQKGIKRTLMEARSIVRFNDESAITNIYEFFEENGTAYIVMEYLEGCNLREYSKNYKEILPFDMIMNLAVSICDVLDVVHKENIIHRDISPDNIFYCSKKKIYKLIDFGAVKQVDSSYMQSSTIYLKHGFAPIEQYSGSGQVGPWTDIYGFGATLYVLSTGKMPAPSVDRIGEDSLVAPRKINHSLPIEFNDAILKAMAVQAKDRFKNAEEFKNALLKCVQKNEETYSEEQYKTEKAESHNFRDTEPYNITYEKSGFTEYDEKTKGSISKGISESSVNDSYPEDNIKSKADSQAYKNEDKIDIEEKHKITDIESQIEYTPNPYKSEAVLNVQKAREKELERKYASENYEVKIYIILGLFFISMLLVMIIRSTKDDETIVSDKSITEATTEATTEEVKEWKISDIATNTSETDKTTNEDTITKTSIVYFHFSIIDGPSDEEIEIIAKESNNAIDNSVGNSEKECMFNGKYKVGDDLWYWTNCYNMETGEAKYFNSGSISVKFYNAKTNEYLGGKTVQINE